MPVQRLKILLAVVRAWPVVPFSPYGSPANDHIGSSRHAASQNLGVKSGLRNCSLRSGLLRARETLAVLAPASPVCPSPPRTLRDADYTAGILPRDKVGVVVPVMK